MNRVEPQLFSKIYELYKNYAEIYSSFPKSKRYSLGTTIDKNILSIIELIIEAEFAVKQYKIQLLQKSSVKIDVTKVLVRLARDTKCVDDKKYQLLSVSLVEIGKMIGGWIKSLK